MGARYVLFLSTPDVTHAYYDLVGIVSLHTREPSAWPKSFARKESISHLAQSLDHWDALLPVEETGKVGL